jgi:uncharacterized protein (DUF1330 family)
MSLQPRHSRDVGLSTDSGRRRLCPLRPLATTGLHDGKRNILRQFMRLGKLDSHRPARTHFLPTKKNTGRTIAMTVNEISRRLFGAFTLAAGTTMASPKAVAQSDVQGSFRPMKMRSIIVNELTVTDPVRYKVYQDQVPATLALFGGQYVSRGTPEPIIGDVPSSRIVVLEFPSREKALAWFHSPEFQRILAIRNEASTSRVYFLEGQ